MLVLVCLQYLHEGVQEKLNEAVLTLNKMLQVGGRAGIGDGKVLKWCRRLMRVT